MFEAYIDGSKFEADVNKYKFVWKPTKYHETLSNKVRDLLKRNNLDRGIITEGIIDSKRSLKRLQSLTNYIGNAKINRFKKIIRVS